MFVVRNTQNAYLNCVEIRFLSKLSLSNCSKWLYFLRSWIIPIQIHIPTPIIHANANNDTSKLVNIRKIIENISTENIFENCNIHELNVSWNATKIELLT